MTPGALAWSSLLVVFLASAPARAETLRQCLEMGVATSRTARSLAAELARQRALLGENRSAFKPKFTVTHDTTGFSLGQATDQLASQTALSASVTDDGQGGRVEILDLSQSLFVHDAVELVRARVNWAIARLNHAQSLEDYKFSVISKFYDALRARARVETFQESVERWARALAFAQVKFDLGSTSKIDVLNTRVNEGNAETQLLGAQQELQSALDQLKDLLGVEMTRPLTVEESIDFHRVETAPVAWERREVTIARLRHDVARANLRDAEQRVKPDLRVDTSYRSTHNSGFVQNGVVLQSGTDELIGAVTYNFQLGHRGADYELDRLKQEREQARLALEQQLATVEREKRDILRALELKERAIATARESYDQARESYEFSLDAFQKGIITNLELRDSQDKLTQAKDAYTSLLIDYKLAARQYVKVFGGTL